MKTNNTFALAAVFLFLIMGCTNRHGHNQSLTEAEKEKIRSEVRLAAGPLMTGWAALDGTTALKSFSPDMVSCYDTMLLDYPSYARSWDAYTGAREKILITPVREDIIILAPDLAINSWVGYVDEWMKSGEKVSYRPIRYTNVFRLSDGEWKIIFAQSSGIPVTENP